MKIPSKIDFINTVARVSPHVHQTPILTSRLLNEISGAQLYFKCENFQKMGAFKMRGAINAMLKLSEAQKRAGVVTHSSGNFAQAVSLAAKNLNIPAYIVMPSNAPQVKVKAVKGYGGQITTSNPTIQSREEEALKIEKETGATFLHPSNNIDVILGQGTAAFELLEKHTDLDIIATPVGGGGLLAGTAVAAHYFGNTCTVIAGEPFEADDAFQSLQAGSIQYNDTVNTVADGLRTHLGNHNFPIIQELVSQIIRVDEEEIITAMRLIWERLKIIIEPSSAVPVAAILREKHQFKGKKIGVIISGGNVDLSNLPF
ncbi:serine/threonine dehydratase [Patiriisocius marinistellae]|uniref:Serine/threonine dehydratase n=1 Tax=Patiriisocius marinistellae TaxID=2494560 RepID=A0A5J4G2C2_9FLAO|nr:pyridoxal-phosphate dependent enzyme [Patiriisocius marinistellae]GEQ86919.1 serine/threonine dehydratase [Patiriisocius marinistellae]